MKWPPLIPLVLIVTGVILFVRLAAIGHRHSAALHVRPPMKTYQPARVRESGFRPDWPQQIWLSRLITGNLDRS